MVFWMCAVIIAVVSYVVGGVNGAIIASKFIFRKDIREYGSKNAGLTNFYRVFGVKGLVVVLAIDIIKAVLCTVLSGIIFAKFGRAASFGRLCSGLFVIVGHIWPVMYGFKGGKGALATEVVACVFDWRIGVAAIIIFILIVVLTRYVSLGSVIASFTFPVATAILGYGPSYIVLAALCCALIVVKHVENISRLIKGRESKLSFSGKGKQ